MAKKRPKQAKRSKPPALSTMSEEALMLEILAHLDFQMSSTPEENIFIELFNENGFDCIPVKDDLFLAAHPDGFALMIEHNEGSPVISINMPLKKDTFPLTSKESSSIPTGAFSNIISNCGRLYSST